MSIVQAKYAQLAPHGDFLKDVVVLAQAWKKTHTAIRRHNWYADVLELDCSTIDLERQLEQWAMEVASQTFAPAPMMLVPAPKNARWDFPPPPPSVPLDLESLLDMDLFSQRDADADEEFEAWGVAEDGRGQRVQKIRPLAHLSIRDQTLATAVMLCLSDAVESAQGDPSVRDGLKAQKQSIFSYGNRLHCRWDQTTRPRPRAFFSWGNSRTYSQYFQDYRAFLARPRTVCAELSGRLNGARELFIISLDIRSFFDCIDRIALVGQLKALHKEFVADFGLAEQLQADDDFWGITERIFNWEWRPDDRYLASDVMDAEKPLPMGLPQGLVAAGFLANAYMVGFDRLVSSAIDADVDGVVIRDYCRYVDDIRLVVEADRREDATTIAERVQRHVAELLRQHCSTVAAATPLSINEEKTTAKPYSSISRENNVSALMELHQKAISGTFDLDSLIQATGGLDGLLWLSEQLDDPHSRKTSPLQLANIAVANADVRDDTIKRFAATRIASTLRMRLAMTDTEGAPESDLAVNESVNAGAALNHEFEAMARKLIMCWANNPALTLLLRVGLDLFPHPRLIVPVLEALESKLYTPAKKDSRTTRQEVLVAEYVAADLLRAGATETGHREDAAYPDSADITRYRQQLSSFARRLLLERGDRSPWYLKQQAMLYLASVGDHSVATTQAAGLENYRILHRALLYSPCKENDFEKALPLALVGQQLAPAPDRFAAWLIESLRATKSPDVIKRCVLAVALNRPDLMQVALRTRSRKSGNWRQHVPSSLERTRATNTTATRRSLRLANDVFLSLHSVISGDRNEFSQENALLALAKAVLEADGIGEALEKGLHVGQMQIRCSDWSRIQALPSEKDFLTICFQAAPVTDPLYERPPWVEAECAWLYGLGRILRSCITGEFDFTAARYLATEDASRYSGLRSTWFKRRFGLLNNGRGLLDEPAPISPWLSGLLSVLLQWPGTDIEGQNATRFLGAKTRIDILDLILERITEQRALYGGQSATPMYVVPTQEDRTPEPRAMRIAIVQPMLPRRDQFNDKEPCRWSRKLMAQHRRHLAEVCRLTYQKLRTWATAQEFGEDRAGTGQPLVDVILFPELSVHPEHISHLRVLSDKVKASIFAGLTFIESPKNAAPINQGLWLIRTETPGGGRTFQYAWQGKNHPTVLERKMGVKGYRPYQLLVEFPIGGTTPTRVAAAICYDATDLALVADLRERSDVFLVAAHNQDIQTFDNMVAALHFHMYQPVILANMGEYGGSTAQAPLRQHERLIAHVHGGNQVAVSVFEVDPSPFKSTATVKMGKELKTPPAGYKGRPQR